MPRGRKSRNLQQFWAHCANKKCEFHHQRFGYSTGRFLNVCFCFNCGHKIYKACPDCNTKIIGHRGNEFAYCEHCGRSHYKEET